jgi:hypothetical protein
VEPHHNNDPYKPKFGFRRFSGNTAGDIKGVKEDFKKYILLGS